MLLHYLEKLKIQIFCKYSADMEENANKLHFCRPWLCYWSTNFNIFGVQHSEFFAILVANKIFHVSVLLLVYFCDKFEVSEIHTSNNVEASVTYAGYFVACYKVECYNVAHIGNICCLYGHCCFDFVATCVRSVETIVKKYSEYYHVAHDAWIGVSAENMDNDAILKLSLSAPVIATIAKITESDDRLLGRIGCDFNLVINFSIWASLNFLNKSALFHL